MNQQFLDITQPQDIRQVAVLAAAIWPHCYGSILAPGQIEYMIAEMYSEKTVRAELQEGIVYRLLQVDGVPSGFISYGPVEPGILKVHKLYLLPKLHRRGLGRLMMDDAAAYGRAHGFKQLHLNVNRNNAPAIQFYRHYGFTVAEEKKQDIGHGYFMDDFIMSYSL